MSFSRTASSSGAARGSGAGATASAAPPPPQQQQRKAAAELPSTADSLRAALGELASAEAAGLASLEELEAQRESLARIQRKVDEVEAHADRGSSILRGMCVGALRRLARRRARRGGAVSMHIYMY
jgi:hypothetical protein